MWVLLGTTITASFLDSLNPSAIAQQMLLQAMVKDKRQIWCFIGGIGAANLALGLAVYYGIVNWATCLLRQVAAAYPLALRIVMLAAGGVCLLLGLFLLRRTRRAGSGESAEAKVPARLSPLSLVLLGAAFCAVELSSAFPYFGFLALLGGYQLAFPLVLLYILLYDLIYILPLILLYFAYNRLQGTTAIRRLERLLGRVSAYVVPAVVTLLGFVLLAVALL